MIKLELASEVADKSLRLDLRRSTYGAPEEVVFLVVQDIVETRLIKIDGAAQQLRVNRKAIEALGFKLIVVN